MWVQVQNARRNLGLEKYKAMTKKHKKKFDDGIRKKAIRERKKIQESA